MIKKDVLPKVSITGIDDDPRKNIMPVGTKRNENKGILVIYTGGTIGSIPKDPNDDNSPMIVAKWPEFRAAVEVLNEIPFRIDAISFSTPLDSSNIGPQHWIAMAKIIGNQNYYDDYEGFVILHGTDTMVYTASMLSFMLQNVSKPVIITGSQIPVLKKVRNDALQNLVTAIQIANPRYTNIPVVKEVCIFFRDKLLRGNRTRKMDASGYTAFHSPNYPVLGTAGDRIEIEEKFLRQPRGEFRPVYTLNRNVIIMDLFPGFQERSRIRDLIFDPDIVNAIVLKTYGTGNIPTELPDMLFSLDSGAHQNIFPEIDPKKLQESFDLTPGLRKIFEDEKFPLPENPELSRIDKNNWELSDR
ncbi:asparaginase, partial [Acidobacteriota bacterium]